MPREKPFEAPYPVGDVEAFLSHISFPIEKFPMVTKEQARTRDGLKFLAALLRYTLAAVPFENLLLHYSPYRAVTIDKDILFEKIVASNCGRGGYCMENNLFFAKILQSLGYEVISTGARVLLEGDSPEWSHQVNLVSLDDQIYMIDIGFGKQGPTRPLPLIDDHISKWGATEAEMRVTYNQGSKPWVQGLWTYQHRNSPKDIWAPMYHFTNTEFLPGDFRIMNHSVSTSRTSFFTYRIIVTKMLLDKEMDDIVGAIILNQNEVKKHIQDKSEVLAELKTEEDRVEALAKHFGIFLTERERAGIRGTVAALK